MVLEYLWSDWKIGLAVAATLAAAAGLIGAWLTPRGPITTGEALASMAAALVIGILAGLAMGSRWSLLVAPAVFVVALELARRGIDGPTVDGIHLTSLYGVIAFVVGRLTHGVLVLAPMSLGTVYGVWIASHLGRDGSPRLGAVGWTTTGLATLVLLAIA